MGTYAYSGNQNKQRDNHADEYLPDLLNDIQDEIEIVEQVLSGGEEGQVLTADSNGKAQWAAGGRGGGGFIYDGIEETHEYDTVDEVFKINLTLTLNEEPINDDSFVMYKTSNNPLDFSDDFYLMDYTETNNVVYVDVPLGPEKLYVKFYLPTGATMIFLIHEPEGGDIA